MGIKKLLGHRFLFVLVIVATCALTWVSLSRIVIPVDVKVEGSDKIAHFIAYFGFTSIWFFFLFFSEKLNKTFKRSLIIASILCVLFGMLMEVLQALLTSYRSSEWYDVMANTSGTIFVVFIFIVFKNKLIKLKQISR
ncbi:MULTISPECIES: VanZ family protein [Aquimarina]|uniref:VanZ-like domain-containing protein n=1 Tax=Aquimarina algiphila TaxID=2047982 RepID=A0A554VJV0_9FLAO|nr:MULTISPECIES: VanZ family protein [Aquimarina]TSE08205.1 hypothetical protein FOF46_13455 [Aquimarina algiphila]